MENIAAELVTNMSLSFTRRTTRLTYIYVNHMGGLSLFYYMSDISCQGKVVRKAIIDGWAKANSSNYFELSLVYSFFIVVSLMYICRAWRHSIKRVSLILPKTFLLGYGFK